MASAGQSGSQELRRQSAVESVLYWSAGSLLFALVTVLAVRAWAPMGVLVAWAGAQLLLTTAAIWARLTLKNNSERALMAAPTLGHGQGPVDHLVDGFPGAG